MAIALYRHFYRQKTNAFAGADDVLGLTGGYSSASIVNYRHERPGALISKNLYIDTARLPSQVAPLIFADGTFALKGARYWPVTAYDGRFDCRSTDPTRTPL
ncbi:MAG: hypothetical protein ACYC05_05985 [Sulfuricella sp.]